MSQAKVDRYKEEKKNRARDMKRAKIKKALIIFLAALIIGAAIGIPLGRWLYNYKQTHVSEEDAFISSYNYTDWFNQYWVDNYSDFYTGSELATDEPASDTEEGSASENAATDESSSAAENDTEAPSAEGTSAVQ